MRLVCEQPALESRTYIPFQEKTHEQLGLQYEKHWSRCVKASRAADKRSDCNIILQCSQEPFVSVMVRASFTQVFTLGALFALIEKMFCKFASPDGEKWTVDQTY